MKRLAWLQVAMMLGCVLETTGCSENKPPEKSVIEKLNSDNPSERTEGLEEADEQYGSGT